MRLIDADELLKEVISIHDGWLQPQKDWHSVEDSIKNAPTVYKDKPIKPELNWKSYYAFCGSCKQPIVELIVSAIGYIPYKKYCFCPWCGTKIEWGH